jgi:hypothetical protein
MTKFKLQGKSRRRRYPPGYWTRVIGGYVNTDLRIAVLDQQRRGRQDARVERAPAPQQDS